MSDPNDVRYRHLDTGDQAAAKFRMRPEEAWSISTAMLLSKGHREFYLVHPEMAQQPGSNAKQWRRCGRAGKREGPVFRRGRGGVRYDIHQLDRWMSRRHDTVRPEVSQ